MRRLYRKKEGCPEVHPRYFQVEPTNICNIRCLMCWDKHPEAKSGTMDLSLFERLLEEGHRLRHIQLAGLGEPTLHPEIHRIVEMAKNRDRPIFVALNTNCTRIDGTMAEKLMKSGIDHIRVSTDTADPAVYKEIRGIDFDLFTESLENLIKARQRLGARSTRISINAVVMTNTLDSLDDLIEFAGRKKLPLYLKSCYVKNEGQSDLRVDLKRFKDAIAHWKRCAARHRVHLHYSAPFPAVTCIRMWSGGYMDCHGAVFPCTRAFNLKLGALSSQSLPELWNSPQVEAIRKEFRSGRIQDNPNPALDPCRLCVYEAYLRVATRKSLPLDARLTIMAQYMYLLPRIPERGLGWARRAIGSITRRSSGTDR